MTTAPFLSKLAQGQEFTSPATSPQLQRQIPKSGEKLPAVGLGTYQAFERLGDQAEQQRLRKVLQLFANAGGRVIDSSPMYGGAEAALGTLLSTVKRPSSEWFLSTKVWTDGADSGRRQMRESSRKMKSEVIDLMQIHNLRDWKSHLPVLKELKEAGKIRYLGLTTWGGYDHDILRRVMRDPAVDFIQITYNITHRKVERQILPEAADLKLAVLANRPFDQGGLFAGAQGRQVPRWAQNELGITSWAQFFLKFILSDPRITAVIPATSNPKHLHDNMKAGIGPLPDKSLRERMSRTVRAF